MADKTEIRRITEGMKRVVLVLVGMKLTAIS